MHLASSLSFSRMTVLSVAYLVLATSCEQPKINMESGNLAETLGATSIDPSTETLRRQLTARMKELGISKTKIKSLLLAIDDLANSRMALDDSKWSESRMARLFNLLIERGSVPGVFATKGELASFVAGSLKGINDFVDNDLSDPCEYVSYAAAMGESAGRSVAKLALTSSQLRDITGRVYRELTMPRAKKVPERCRSTLRLGAARSFIQGSVESTSRTGVVNSILAALAVEELRMTQSEGGTTSSLPDFVTSWQEAIMGELPQYSSILGRSENLISEVTLTAQGMGLPGLSVSKFAATARTNELSFGGSTQILVSGGVPPFVAKIAATDGSVSSDLIYTPPQREGVFIVSVRDAAGHQSSVEFLVTKKTGALETGYIARTSIRLMGDFMQAATCRTTDRVLSLEPIDGWYRVKGLSPGTVYEITCESGTRRGHVVVRTLDTVERFFPAQGIVHEGATVTDVQCYYYSRTFSYNPGTGRLEVFGRSSQSGWAVPAYTCFSAYDGFTWSTVILRRDNIMGPGWNGPIGDMTQLKDGTIIAAIPTGDASDGNRRVAHILSCRGNCLNASEWSTVVFSGDWCPHCPWYSDVYSISALAQTADGSRIAHVTPGFMSARFCETANDCTKRESWSERVILSTNQSQLPLDPIYDAAGGLWVSFSNWDRGSTQDLIFHCPAKVDCTKASNWVSGRLEGMVNGLNWLGRSYLHREGTKIQIFGDDAAETAGGPGTLIWGECDTATTDCGFVSGKIFVNWTRGRTPFPSFIGTSISIPFKIEGGFALIHSFEGWSSASKCYGSISKCGGLSVLDWGRPKEFPPFFSTMHIRNAFKSDDGDVTASGQGVIVYPK